MCIASHKPAGAEISLDTLQRCWTHHPYGGGLALPDGDGGVTVHKAMTWDEFAAEWDEHGDPAAPIVIHFRWATHGTISLDNCHPHRISSGPVVAHNGVIHPVADHVEPRSDTVAFVETVLRHIPIEAITSPGVSALLEEYIGRSRLVFLNADGQATIVGESRGIWADGCWYSNDTYHRAPIRRRAARTLPTETYPSCREDQRDEEERRSAAHDLLDRYGYDLSLWSDEDRAVLAMAYEDDVDWTNDDPWEEVA